MKFKFGAIYLLIIWIILTAELISVHWAASG